MIDLKKAVGQWVSDQTTVIPTNYGYEVATHEIDAQGDTVYVWVESAEDGWLVSDDGRLLFKLDPSIEDEELVETVEFAAIGAGYEFSQNSGMISVKVSADQLGQAIMRLAMLQVALSYLG